MKFKNLFVIFFAFFSGCAARLSTLEFSKSFNQFIALIYQRIKGKIDGPLYGHCWNGWHASGYVASITLKQFCGYTDQQALDYWIKNTDGDNNYEKIKQKVKSWKPLEKYKISSSESALICP